MSHIKVLPLPSFFKLLELQFKSSNGPYTFIKFDFKGNPINTATTELKNKAIEKRKEFFAERMRLIGYIEVPVVFNRNGWYHNRIRKTTWFEFYGSAWTSSGSQDFFFDTLKNYNDIEQSKNIKKTKDRHINWWTGREKVIREPGVIDITPMNFLQKIANYVKRFFKWMR